jgi:hypothetical protein
VPEGAAALRAALRGDCHTHSTWSDGLSSSILERSRRRVSPAGSKVPRRPGPPSYCPWSWSSACWDAHSSTSRRR